MQVAQFQQSFSTLMDSYLNHSALSDGLKMKSDF